MKRSILGVIFVAFMVPVLVWAMNTVDAERIGSAALVPSEYFAVEYSEANSGTSREELTGQPETGFIKVGHSSTHLNYYTVQCRAWLTCRSGKRISCVSTGSWCTSSDANNQVACYAPGASAVDRCN